MSESTMTVNKLGSKIWKNSAEQFHRTGGPAVEYNNGDKEWWVNDYRHRSEGPAIERANGDKEWWVNGKQHRAEGPAVERANGNKAWYVNGKPQRKNGPAVEWANGDKAWYVNGKLLGYDDKGFWKLWDTLTDEQKKDPVLLSYLPGDFHV